MNNTMMIRNPQTNEWEPVYLPPTGDTFPIGAYAFIAGEQTPTNWLRCDGQAVSRTEYADLFNVIGTTYGAGDGSTTFNLPNVNLENRTLVGSSGDGEFALGNTMGEKEVKLELENYIYGVYNNDDKNEKNDISMMFHPTGNSYGLGSVYISNKNEPHNNMQPSIASICIIKAKQSVGIVGPVTSDINDTNENAVANAKTVKEYVDNKTQQDIITGGIPVKAGYKEDDKDVYVQKFKIASLPNATQAEYEVNTPSNINISKVEGSVVFANGDSASLPYAVAGQTANISSPTYLSTKKIRIATVSNRSSDSAIVRIYFTYEVTE